ncbi:cyclic nucleotide-binding domain-containing protein [Marinobacter sp. S6332]|uniref:cyclic nucleotide-binding domain-containing protein n=1 Tax=Marinobacter sp. S6332 TaxID=2926403 RepID=UPI001FF32E4F|nr:cyclic nucleotide-binding domain-containing protein [Marinobacter sp. S6332]MCK0165679.1 cyclic nucleotide-binding domain-containing protein [Marinobacter sp. S6332]
MTLHVHIAIIGSGPAGLSAAARAAQRDRARMEAGEISEPTHILLESFSQPAKTIQRYQKGKFVMAEPGFLHLRSDCEFGAGSREAILEQWQEDIARNGIKVRYQAEVQAITGERGNFSLALANGDVVTAEVVILAIGLEGNPRKLNIAGEGDSALADRVQYTLDDPEEFNGERIVVVGAGDSALENALALSKKNHVTVINRRAEFSRAKEANLNAILQAINDRRTTLDCLYETNPAALEADDDGINFAVETPTGRKVLSCDRIIARLGGFPPRKFIESIGIEFSSEAIDAAPILNGQYESSVPGIYVVGSLAGYPLIKQAMNQGYDVVEYIHGNDIKPADHELLEFQFGLLPYRRPPDELLHLFQQRIPMFSQLNVLVFRQLVIESSIWVALEGPSFENTKKQAAELAEAAAQRQPSPKTGKLIRAGESIFQRGDYTNTFFMIVDGEVILERHEQSAKPVRLERGQFFGEDSLVSGRPREYTAVAGSDCVLVETPRRTMIKLLNSNDQVRRGIDWIFTVRALQKHFAPELSPGELREIAQTTQLNTYQAGEPLFRQDQEGDCLHVIRRGAVTLQRSSEEGDLVVAQLQADELVGEMALMGEPVRRHTAKASVLTETIVLHRDSFMKLVNLDSSSISQLQARASKHARTYTTMQAQADKGSLIGFMMGEGMGEATNAMVIDESLCIGCDHCEKACADTHDGISRLNRSEGPSFAQMHLAISCRHCEHPHCMKDCPPDAIHRAESGEVFIDDSCIGCGNCVTHCPYDAIQLAHTPQPRQSLFSWLLKGAPDKLSIGREDADQGASGAGKKAVKCDACMNFANGPACVNACPTGAAARLAPEHLVKLVAKQ